MVIVFSFTRKGTELNRKVCTALSASGKECQGYAAVSYASGQIRPLPEKMHDYIESKWGKCTFLFIGACGIAVRYIAASVRDKFSDSPVIVADENGQYVIPLLSGHVGGAVSFAEELSELIGAVCVHTTATDVNQKFAVDVFARRNHLFISDRIAAKRITSAILEGEKVAFCVIPGFLKGGEGSVTVKGIIPGELCMVKTLEEMNGYRYGIAVWDAAVMEKDEKVLQRILGLPGNSWLVLIPQNIIAGIGCRRGISLECLENGLKAVFEKRYLSLECLKMISSIDRKKDERALLKLSEKYNVPYVTYTADELQKSGPVTLESEFVKRVTGVDNVCERAAMTACPDGILICPKKKKTAMTAALLAQKVELDFHRKRMTEENRNGEKYERKDR